MTLVNGTIKHRDELLDAEPDSDYIEHSADYPWEEPQEESNSELPKNIHGSAALVGRIETLCKEYKDIFSSNLRPEPALLPPMELKADYDKWQKSANRRPYRAQTMAKQYDTTTN